MIPVNATLNDDARRSGGLNRDKGRPDWEKQFMGVLAGSSRPLKKDHQAASDLLHAVNLLKVEADRFPWLVLSLVGRDGGTVESNMPEADIASAVHRMGGAIGIAGLILLRDRLTTFVRPFVAGLDIEQRLTAAMEDLKADIFFGAKMSRAPFWAKIYTNGQKLSCYYSWEVPQRPEHGWELAGVVYLAPTPSGNWKTETRTMDDKWAKVVRQATRLFTAKVKLALERLRNSEL